jgi:hypothetical protein
MANAYNNDNGQNSPVLYVQNKSDKEKGNIDESVIKKKFNNIEDFIKISCTDIEQFPALPKLITKSISKISNDIFTAQYNTEWLGVKQDLNDLKKEGTNHITKQRFDEICAERGLTAEESKSWLTVLDRIGTVICFGDNKNLSDWVVLNPLWVKDAICKVIDFKNHGRTAAFNPEVFDEIWEHYKYDERPKLLALLLAYDFCYEKDEWLIVPALFSDKKPKYTEANLSSFDCDLKMCYHPFLPAGTLHKFMVKQNDRIYKTYHWKSGVVVHNSENNTYGEVTEDWETHTINIRLKGPNNLKPIWDIIQNTFQDINATLKTTKLVHYLEFKVYCLYNSKWKAIADVEDLCRFDSKNIFQFLFDFAGVHKQPNNRDGRTDLSKKMIDNSKPYPVPMAEGARNFVPFSEIKEKIKILFIASNPSDASRLKTDVEYRKIKAEMYRGRHRDKFDFLQPQLAVTIHELVRAMNDRPHIVHFSGHGEEEGILITTGDNVSQLLPTPAIKRLFKPLQNSAQVVLLNACYSAIQAEEISKFGFYVVGYQEPIGDDAAIGFAQGLYNGFGEGKSFEDAYNDAMVVLLTVAAEYEDIVEVWKDGQKLDL